MIAAVSALMASCSSGSMNITGSVDDYPKIWPDYKDAVIPSNIAPLNFSYSGEGEAVLIIDGKYRINARNGLFKITKRTWKELMGQEHIEFMIASDESGEWMSYKPFQINVSKDEIDPYISYRLIPPGYQGWKRMGIYQRDLTGYKQTPIYENKLGNENCVNCHTPCNGDPEKRVFHLRADFGGTILANDGTLEKLNTKTDSTISALVYPFWHPSGKYIAFSVNSTRQSFFSHDPNRIEVFDSASDVVVYDVEKKELFWSPLTKTSSEFETFPAFSPDGRWMYFCSSKAVEKMPDDYAKAKYSLKRIAFNAEDCSFGDSLETVFDAAAMDRSVSFPRVSPDGRFLCFTCHGYGNFSIWHKDADLWMIDLETGEASPMGPANSSDVDSYHSWSRNGRWIVFSSRRDDGLYTKPYICHVDEEGHVSKPFLLPQKNPKRYYHNLMFSYNIPEFMVGKVRTNQARSASVIRTETGVDVNVRTVMKP